MNIQVNKPEFEKFIDEQVRQGSFSSANEVIEAGLARLMLDSSSDDFDAETKAAIDRAVGQFERGEDRSFKEFAAEFRARHLRGG
jgi:Arc/MetJ-type ribon-helix-helix transcriptional regulator